MQARRDGRAIARRIMERARRSGFAQGPVPAGNARDYPDPAETHDGVVVQLITDRGPRWELRAGRIDLVLGLVAAALRAGDVNALD